MKPLAFRSAADIAAAIPLVAGHLAGGGLLAYPTETVYGLGSRINDADIAALLALKHRTPGKPFLVLVAGVTMVTQLGLVFTPAARAMANACWPGPLTL